MVEAPEIPNFRECTGHFQCEAIALVLVVLAVSLVGMAIWFAAMMRHHQRLESHHPTGSTQMSVHKSAS